MIPYYSLFQFLQKHPKANFSKIAEALDITDKTAKAHYQYLVKNGYIEGIRAKFKPETLGLETVSFIVKVSEIRKLEILEKLADFHDFTIYRNRILGASQGLFLQFNIPNNSIRYLEALFIKLININLIEGFEKIQGNDFKASSAPEFEFYDNEKGEWIWDIQSWREDYEKASDTIVSEIKQEINVLDKIQDLDLKLLREMTINAKQAHNDLAEKFQVTPVRISRRMTFLNENVNDYVLLYKRAKVQPVDLVLFRGKCSEINRTKLYNTLKKTPIPFDTGFNLLSDGYIWRMNIPPSYTSLFSNFLWSISEKLIFYRLDHYTSKLYYFYGDSYDSQKKEWKASKNEVLDQPLEWLKKQL